MSRNDGKVRVTIKENGTTVTLRSGDVLEVALPATLGTGYSWKVANSAANVLKAQGKPEAGSAETASKAGQPENQVFLFNTLAKGTGQLEMQYQRPWEKDRKPAKTFSLTIKVE
jgi:inhibitor of cysteine peptidase